MKNPQPTGPDQLLLQYLAADEREKEAKAEKDRIKELLEDLRAEGVIDKKFSAYGCTAQFTTTKRWTYNHDPDFTRLQQSMQLDGRATQVESSSWRINVPKPKD